MKLIERYIFTRACLASLLVLGSLLGVVWVVQALRQVDVITANSQSIFTYLSITTLAVPGLILAIIPIALLLAAIFTINTLNSNINNGEEGHLYMPIRRFVQNFKNQRVVGLLF